jgi:putative ABC transport system substrate-binding protein
MRRRKFITLLGRGCGSLAVCGFREDAEADALISFGFNLDAQWRLGAGYVDQILRGARPANLPVQQPTRFETIINLKTAKALGIDVPTSLLVERRRGDRIRMRFAALHESEFGTFRT